MPLALAPTAVLHAAASLHVPGAPTHWSPAAHRLHSCCSLLPVPLHAGQLRGSVNMLLPSLLLPSLLLSGLHCRTMISPLPLHTLQAATWLEASAPDPCSTNKHTHACGALTRRTWTAAAAADEPTLLQALLCPQKHVMCTGYVTAAAAAPELARSYCWH